MVVSSTTNTLYGTSNMSTLTKQRFFAGFVFSFFLAIGFTVSLSVASFSTKDDSAKIAKTVKQVASPIAADSAAKNIDIAGLQVKK